MNIYVGNLPRTTNQESVRTAFEKFGDVADVKLIKDQYTNQLRGFGFVTMASNADGTKAIQELNDTDFEGRKLTVNEAKPRKQNNDRGGFGGNNRSW